MAQLLNIVDDTVIINKLALKYTAGTVVHAGTLQVVGKTQLDGGLKVSGTLTADTISVKNLITENGSLDGVGNWVYDDELELNGKGFSWTAGANSTQFMYRTGNRLWANANFDLASGNSFRIDDIPVISANSLGETVVRSNLRQIGTLDFLKVSGDTMLGDFAVFNSTHNRLGIGTDEPDAAITILENNVEITLGSPSTNLGTIGTYSNHDLGIITDNTPRIVVKGSGEVVIGDELSKTGVLRVYGTLYAESVQTDVRINRTHPLEFKATADTSVYGLGLVWSEATKSRQLIMLSNEGTDKLWSSENIDLANGKSLSINDQVVLSATGLGASVINSNLTTLGTLESLSVNGPVNFAGTFAVETMQTQTMSFDGLSVTSMGISADSSVAVRVQNKKAFYADADQVSIGDSSAQNKPVKVFGPLSIGISNPDPSLNFSVNGDVNLGGKRFTSGLAAPTSGIFQVGDICWNKRPQENSYVGWICIVSGEPGEWMPFGAINRQ